jgi:WD40 repeat protein
VVICCRIGLVMGCEARSGWQVCTLTGHTDTVRSVAISRDGTCIVSGSRDTLLKIWNSATGAEVSTFVLRCGWWGCLFVGWRAANGFEGGLR